MASNIFAGQRTVTAAATAVSVDALIRGAPGANQPAAFAGSGIGCALSVTSNVDIYFGTASTLTDANGGILLSAGTPWGDYATGQFGNAVDVTQLFVYAPAAGDATLSIYYRSK